MKERTPASTGDVRIESMSAMPPLPPASQPPPGAIVGRDLSDFRWVDSQVVPRGAGPEIRNIQQVGPGVFAHVLRWRGGWHDGDRHLTEGKYREKGRAELCCLGGNTPFALGTTWLIGTTFRLSPDFVPPRNYCHLMQPVLHQSYFSVRGSGDTFKGSLMAFERGLGSPSREVRSFTFRRGEWVSVVVRVTLNRNGEYALSVNGDAFKGIKGVDATVGNRGPPFGGTWGLYCKNGVRDMVVYHANVWIKKVG